MGISLFLACVSGQQGNLIVAGAYLADELCFCVAHGLGKRLQLEVKCNAFQMVHHTSFMVCGVTTRGKSNNF